MTDAPATWFVVIALGLTVATILVARFSAAGSLVPAAGLLLTIGVATVRWPHPVLVLVVLAPILDRFVAGRFVPSGALALAPFFSEALLLLVSAVLVVQSARSGTFVPALRHPATIAFGVFVAVAAISAVVNRVPAHIALAGLVYTLDAAVLFYLVRIAGFDQRQVRLAIMTLIAVVGVGAVIAIAQAVLSPGILGLTGVVGRSGEDVRIGSIVRDPNVFGTLIGLTIPFSVFAMTRLQRPGNRRVAMAVTFLLSLALLLTYSRGSWLGVGGGLVLVALLLERRALLMFAAIGVLALATGYIMPRGLLPPPSVGGIVEEAEPFNPLGSTVDRVGAIGEGRDLRWMFVMNALPIVADHPLVGVGTGRYGGAVAWNFPTPIYAEYGTDDIIPVWYRQRTVDNFWLHILVETGVMGISALVAAIVLIVVPIVRTARRARAERFVVAAGVLGAAATLSLSSTTTMLLEGNTVAFLYWFLLGIGSVVAAGSWPSSQPAESAASA
ncbi:MAG: O-antigen ligase family protein [Candidatus Limnocylindria bacterium]